MANISQGSRVALLVAGTLVVGLAAGFGLGYYTASRGKSGQPAGYEYVGEARHVNFSGTDPFDVYYPEPFARPPELTILTDEMRRGFDYTLLDQRADGFRIKIGSSANRADKPDGSPWLRYRARGELAPKGQQQ